MRSPNRPHPKGWRLPALFLVALAALAACGSDTETAGGAGTETTETTGIEATGTETTGTETTGTETTGTAGGFPVVVDTAGGELAIEARPQAIVSMSPTATEMLFAIGAGDQVIAVDSFSNHPPEAPITDLSAFEPNVEAIAELQPDLVVIGFPNDDVQNGLAQLGIPVLLQPAAVSLDDTYGQIAELGLITGNEDGAAALNASLRTDIDGILAEFATDGGEPVRVYHELDDTFFTASSGSFIGQIYALLGYENIADVADPDGSIQFPQLQAEQILAADPSLIVITDSYAYGPDEVAARPGWDALTAVSDGNVVQVDADVASRWGPRVVEFLRQVAEAAPAPVAS